MILLPQRQPSSTRAISDSAAGWTIDTRTQPIASFLSDFGQKTSFGMALAFFPKASLSQSGCALGGSFPLGVAVVDASLGMFAACGAGRSSNDRASPSSWRVSLVISFCSSCAARTRSRRVTICFVMLHSLRLSPAISVGNASYIALVGFDELLSALPDESVDVVYADPPFNTGVSRVDPRDKATSYPDDLTQEDWESLIKRLAVGCRRVLKSSGSMYLHLDWRGVHEAKLHAMDAGFGRSNQLGELVWAYDWGGRARDRFARKHDTILHYAKDAGAHRFDVDRVDRVPYKAPGLQLYRAKRLGRADGAARIEAGKAVTDVFHDLSVVGTGSNERRSNSYPTMKPTRLIKRLLAPVVREGDVVLDPFCGSGASMQAAFELGCSFVVGDISQRAIVITERRASSIGAKFVHIER